MSQRGNPAAGREGGDGTSPGSRKLLCPHAHPKVFFWKMGQEPGNLWAFIGKGMVKAPPTERLASGVPGRGGQAPPEPALAMSPRAPRESREIREPQGGGCWVGEAGRLLWLAWSIRLRLLLL